MQGARKPRQKRPRESLVSKRGEEFRGLLWACPDFGSPFKTDITLFANKWS